VGKKGREGSEGVREMLCKSGSEFQCGGSAAAYTLKDSSLFRPMNSTGADTAQRHLIDLVMVFQRPVVIVAAAAMPPPQDLTTSRLLLRRSVSHRFAADLKLEGNFAPLFSRRRIPHLAFKSS
jgi:hypothetical protein